jgi:hypothetical protein
MSASSFADGGVRVHRANQFKNISSDNSNKKEHLKNSQREHLSLLNSLHEQRLRHHNSSQSQRPQTPDSRFPNMYRDLSYSQNLEAIKSRKP